MVPLCLGGDHSIVLGRAARRGDACTGRSRSCTSTRTPTSGSDYYGARYFHGTVFKRGGRGGPGRPARARSRRGCAGRSTARATSPRSAELGYDASDVGELERLTPEQYGDRVRARVGDAPAFLTFDIDFVDPAFAPGTGTPEVGGPTSSQALAYLRALTGIDFRAFDCVEVSPPTTRRGSPRGWRRAPATR